jgi:hypothetical protein
MKVYWGSGGIVPRILDLGTRWKYYRRFKECGVCCPDLLTSDYGLLLLRSYMDQRWKRMRPLVEHTAEQGPVARLGIANLTAELVAMRQADMECILFCRIE